MNRKTVCVISAAAILLMMNRNAIGQEEGIRRVGANEAVRLATENNPTLVAPEEARFVISSSR